MAVPRPGIYTVSEVVQPGWAYVAPKQVTIVPPLSSPYIVYFGNHKMPRPHDWAHEFYNVDLDHYFMTVDPAEVNAVLNGAAGAGWQYTGEAIPAYASAATASPNTRAVCRFYGNQAQGGPNGHFYTVDPDECAQVKKDPGWAFERDEFLVGVPQDRECASGMNPVYRVYNGRFSQKDSNHRYMTDPAIYEQMIESGWQGEGVVFCAAQTEAAGPVSSAAKQKIAVPNLRAKR